MSEVLAARGLSKSFAASGGPEVLAGVDLSLAAGASLAVTGASGCGKSTLLHIAGGLARPDEGTVMIDGVALAGLGGAARSRLHNQKLGFVYQFHHLLAEFTAAENVAMPMLVAGTGRRAALARATELLGDFGLAAAAARHPAALSGGERQRVAIARALANGPKLVIADEPTGNLDAKAAAGVFELLLRQCAERGCALLAATHNLELAANLGAVRRLQGGRLEPAAAAMN
ncbi:MAG: ABC transporter ATP-binding protein [Betaproteobacteria bacterium AqS2]|uniref:ABC transporter ATP-binding protein n=1 Tax=Candidatus Amphirhobacter heronislandensis TaxID=1732024 RepID=A0A930UGM8_9GAMM|nr:ABC transporter ATP-binding protein [Betaproteobacteria bacterium AqS2]